MRDDSQALRELLELLLVEFRRGFASLEQKLDGITVELRQLNNNVTSELRQLRGEFEDRNKELRRLREQQEESSDRLMRQLRRMEGDRGYLTPIDHPAAQPVFLQGGMLGDRLQEWPILAVC